MNPKEYGFVLSIDQASNVAGVSLWFSGGLIATTTLLSARPSDPFSRRVQDQVAQLTTFLETHTPPETLIDRVIFEGVRARLVICVVGAFMTCPRIDAKLSEKANFVESSSWKNYARARGATGPFSEIKGVKALTEIGWDMVKHPVVSDDIADSILMYSCWASK